jgi:hypothetical protein
VPGNELIEALSERRFARRADGLYPRNACRTEVGVARGNPSNTGSESRGTKELLGAVVG